MADVPTDPNKRTVARPGKASGKPKRRRRGGLTFLLFIGVIVAIALFAWAENQRRTVERQLADTESRLEEVQNSTQKNGQEVAQQVLAKVRNHLDLPTDPQPTVATIVDVDKLKQTSDFYSKAKNGDHLIITENRAILYDPDRDIILDMVPVRVNTSPTPTPADSTPDPNATATPEGSPSATPPAGQNTSPSPSSSPVVTP